MPTISPCLWFNDQAEEAAEFYCSIFPNSKTTSISRYTEAGRELHGQEPGAVMTIDFELDGQPFTALNGGPMFEFNPAVSLQIHCDTQDEIDHFWEKLSEGGDENARQCGWLKDKYGLSWQVVPTMLAPLLQGPDLEKSVRATEAMLQMKKLDIQALQDAYDGTS